MDKGSVTKIFARRNTIDNASNNVNKMMSEYSVFYKRTRQTAITNELVDIIISASSLD